MIQINSFHLDASIDFILKIKGKKNLLYLETLYVDR